MILVGLTIALGTLVPLFLASVVLIQELRRDSPDVALNLRTATAIWLGIGIGAAATVLVLTRLGLAV
jgi:predicted MFS family arabinose efflux permease